MKKKTKKRKRNVRQTDDRNILAKAAGYIEIFVAIYEIVSCTRYSGYGVAVTIQLLIGICIAVSSFYSLRPGRDHMKLMIAAGTGSAAFLINILLALLFYHSLSRVKFDSFIILICIALLWISTGWCYKEMICCDAMLDMKRYARIVNTTTNPSEFFNTYQQLISASDKLVSLGWGLKYSGDLPKKVNADIKAKKQPAIRNMIDRYYEDCKKRIYDGMNFSFDEFPETLEPYFGEMDEDNKVHVECLHALGFHNYNRERDFDRMTGIEFENYCALLLKKNGYSNAEVTQASGDHGIDILAEKDDITYAIQCKCYSDNIGNAAVQQAHAGKGIYKRDIAIVLTNRYFTEQAKQEAATLGVKLWDRDKLRELAKASKPNNSFSSANVSDDSNTLDALFADAGRFIIEKDKASIGMLQHAFNIGFNRAARIMDQLCNYGVVGEEDGTKPRKVLMSPELFEQLLEEI